MDELLPKSTYTYDKINMGSFSIGNVDLFMQKYFEMCIDLRINKLFRLLYKVK